MAKGGLILIVFFHLSLRVWQNEKKKKKNNPENDYIYNMQHLWTIQHILYMAEGFLLLYRVCCVGFRFVFLFLFYKYEGGLRAANGDCTSFYLLPPARGTQLGHSSRAISREQIEQDEG